MANKTIIILTIAILAITAYAEEINLEQIKEEYNANMANMPNMAKKVLGNENIHAYITGDKEYALITKNGKIEELTEWKDKDNNGKNDDWETNKIKPTMEVRTSTETVERIANSKEPEKEFKKAWGKDIKFKGLRIRSKLKLFGLGIFTKII